MPEKIGRKLLKNFRALIPPNCPMLISKKSKGTATNNIDIILATK